MVILYLINMVKITPLSSNISQISNRTRSRFNLRIKHKIRTPLTLKTMITTNQSLYSSGKKVH